MVIEWVPDRRLLKDREAVEGAPLTGAQEQQLKDIFHVMDHDGSGDLSAEEAKKTLLAIDMTLKPTSASAGGGAAGGGAATAADLDRIIGQMDRNRNGKIDYDEFKHAVSRQSYYSIQEGRHFVLLSLQEAEALRGAMHIAKGQARGMVPQSPDGAFLSGLVLRTGK